MVRKGSRVESRPGLIKRELSRVLVLFTRDLRVRDQPALAAAAREADGVVPLFVLDDALLARPLRIAEPSRHLLDCLRDLDGALRERGSPPDHAPGRPGRGGARGRDAGGAGAIHMSEDVSRHARARERGSGPLPRRGNRAARIPGVTVVAPGEVCAGAAATTTGSSRPTGAPGGAPRRRSLPAPRRMRPAAAGVRAGRIPALRRARGERLARARAGRRDARRGAAGAWLRGGLAGYGERPRRPRRRRDLPAERRPALRLPVPGDGARPRRRAARGEAFSRQLCWRDFHHQVLAALPGAPRADYRPRRRRRWRRDRRGAGPGARGGPGCRSSTRACASSSAEGFMHNRARLVVASFLTKTLGLDWRMGAAHFSGCWSTPTSPTTSATGSGWPGPATTPAQPGAQPPAPGRRFDPDGEYVRRHLCS